MADTIIITSAGRAALVNAQNNGTNAVVISAIGLTASAVVATPAVTNLPGEFKRIAAISGTAVASDIIHLTVRDESTETYSLRSYALYLADGTLFAVYGQPAVIVEKSQNSTLLLAIDIKFADVNAAQIVFGNADFLLPPATEDMQGVIEIATQPEATGGTDDQRALTAKKARLALMTWLLAQDGAGSGLDADLLDGQHASAFLQASLFTGAQILSRLLSVDGAGSGLDADLLAGQPANAFLQASQFTGAQILSRLTTVDGAGSGLDADILAGQPPSYYTNIIARLGYTPLNSTVYTPADVFAKILGLDGAGSGLDADLLDGQHASAFLQASLFTGAQIISKLGFTPLNSALYTAADVFAKVLALDGSGSGFDADLLDGRHASEFALLSGYESGSNANGYWRKTPDGLIEQWGSFTGNFPEGRRTLNFPIAFTDLASVNVQVTAINTATDAGNNDMWTQSGSITLATFNMVFQATSSGNTGFGARWRAIGR